MFSEMIQCDLVDVPPPNPKRRSFNKEFARQLAQSIEIEGQHQPIVVRPNPDKAGRYLLVMGQHRLFAVAKVLKREVIEAKVILDMDDTDADMATIADNLWRNPLKKAQHLLAIQQWHDYYQAKYPHKIGSAAGAKAANAKRAAKATEEPTATPADPAQAPPPLAEEVVELPAPADVPSFPEMVSSVTGESLSSAKVTAKIAKSFTPDQIEVFDQMQVGRNEIHAIAKIVDADQRKQVVNLIASGLEAVEAIARVTKPADGKVKLGNGREVVAKSHAEPAEDAAPAATPDEDSLPDDKWLETYCGEIRGLLPVETRARFDRDATFYRRDRDARNAHRKRSKKAIAAYRAGVKGPYVRAVLRALMVAHPKDWLRCGDCQGQGGTCKGCYGDGYKTKQEG